MRVQTYLFGEIEVSPDKIIDFPAGLVGFEDCKRYTLAHADDQADPLTFTLQSLDDPMLAFEIVDPAVSGFSYELVLSDEESALLQTPAADDVVVMQMLYRKGEGKDAPLTPSLRAPLVINTKARVGLQKVMETLRSNVVLSNLASNV